MSIIGRYHFRALLVATVFVTVVLTFAVWLSQSIAVLEMVAEGGAPISLFLRIVMLMIPEFLAIVLPIALFVCTLFIYHKAQGDCELIVLRASGIGPWRLARPALILAFLVAGVAIATGGWLAPWAKNETRSLVSLIKSNHAGLIIRPNVFNEIHGGPTIYIRDKTGAGEMAGVLVHDQTDPDKPVTLFARRAHLLDGETGPRIQLMDGARQEFDRKSGAITQLDFKSYALDMTLLDTVDKERWRKPQERTLTELFSPLTDEEDIEQALRLRGEGHFRITGALLAPGLVLIALAALLTGQYNRRGQWQRLTLALLALAVVEGGLLALAGWTRASYLASIALYVWAALPAIAGAWMLARSGHRLGRGTP